MKKTKRYSIFKEALGVLRHYDDGDNITITCDYLDEMELIKQALKKGLELETKLQQDHQEFQVVVTALTYENLELSKKLKRVTTKKNTKTVYIYKGTYGRYETPMMYVKKCNKQSVECYSVWKINEYSLLELCNNLQKDGYTIIFDNPDE